jgi:hypothetical protein
MTYAGWRIIVKKAEKELIYAKGVIKWQSNTNVWENMVSLSVIYV